MEERALLNDRFIEHPIRSLGEHWVRRAPPDQRARRIDHRRADADYFRVRLDDGTSWVIRHDRREDDWFLVDVSAP